MRRALSWDDELPRLIRAAASGGEYRGFPGPVRALVYRLAAETGLRVRELQELRVQDAGLERDEPVLTLPAAVAKNRTEACMPLRHDMARALLPHLRGKLLAAALPPLPRSFRDKATRWLHHDLERAGTPTV